MELTRILGHDLLALSASAAAVRPEVAAAFRGELESLRECTMSHFRSTVPALFDQGEPAEWDECDGRIDGIEQRRRRRAQHARVEVHPGHDAEAGEQRNGFQSVVINSRCGFARRFDRHFAPAFSR